MLQVIVLKETSESQGLQHSCHVRIAQLPVLRCSCKSVMGCSAINDP